MVKLSPNIKILYDLLETWEECEDGNTIVNPSHYIAIADTIKCPYGYILIKNSFMVITKQFLNQLKRNYKKTQKQKYTLLWLRIDDDNLIDADDILNLMNQLKIDKVTLYDSKEPSKAWVIVFKYKNIIYYGGIGTREITDGKEYFDKYHRITFKRKTSLRDL
jgi:hypothetical protein